MPTMDSASSSRSRNESIPPAFDTMMPFAPILLLEFIAVVVAAIVIVAAVKRGGGKPKLREAVPSSRPDLIASVNVAIGDDGFWLRSAVVAAGMIIGFRYLVASGGKTSQVQFAPGPDGHWVYTGQRPDHVEITHVSSAESGSGDGSVLGDIGNNFGRDLFLADAWHRSQQTADVTPPPLPGTSSVFARSDPPAY